MTEFQIRHFALPEPAHKDREDWVEFILAHTLPLLQKTQTLGKWAASL